MSETVTADDFRKIGFSETAQFYPRDDLAFAMICAFCGYDPDRAPEALRFFPNESTMKAWQRVADVARAALSEGER